MGGAPMGPGPRAPAASQGRSFAGPRCRQPGGGSAARCTGRGGGARICGGACPGVVARIRSMADGRFRASLLKRGTARCGGRGAGARFGIAADAPTLVIFLSDSLRGSFFFFGTVRTRGGGAGAGAGGGGEGRRRGASSASNEDANDAKSSSEMTRRFFGGAPLSPEASRAALALRRLL